jgi:nitrite reductase (NADH) small subunit
MTQAKWVRITSSKNIPLREGRVVKLGGLTIAVFNLGDRFRAVENRCPHQGGPLADGIVSGATVVCPLHAWKVDLDSGGVVRPADVVQCVRSFQTRVEDGVVLLNLGDCEPQQSDSIQPQSVFTQNTMPRPSNPGA